MRVDCRFNEGGPLGCLKTFLSFFLSFFLFLPRSTCFSFRPRIYFISLHLQSSFSFRKLLNILGSAAHDAVYPSGAAPEKTRFYWSWVSEPTCERSQTDEVFSSNACLCVRFFPRERKESHLALRPERSPVTASCPLWAILAAPLHWLCLIFTFHLLSVTWLPVVKPRLRYPG